jgi:hypothetical protein
VGGPHTPLVGPHSRLGFHHPGPLIFYLLAIPIRLQGGRPSALLAGALLIELVSLVSLIVLTARSAGPAAAVVMAVACALLCVGLGDWILEPWNPYLVVLPFALFLVAAWLAASGDNTCIPIAVVSGTFAAQSHLGALPPFLLITAAMLGLRLWRPPALTVGPSLQRAVIVAASALALLWAPPLIEQLTASQGNASLVAHVFLGSGPDAPAGFAKGTAIAGALLLPWGPWLGRERLGFMGDVATTSSWSLAICFVLPSIAAALSRRFRDDLSLRLAALIVVAMLTCVVASAQIRGIAFPYLTLWCRPVAMLAAASPALVIVRQSARSLAHSGPTTAIALAIACVTLSIRAVGAEVPDPVWSPVYQKLVPEAVKSVPPGATAYVVGAGPLWTYSEEAIAVGLELGGRTARMPPKLAWSLGEHRTTVTAAGLPTLLVASGIAAEELPRTFVAPPVFVHDPLSPAQRAEVRSLRDDLRRRLVQAHRPDLRQPLDDANGWFWMLAPPSLPIDEVHRYLHLASGEDKMPVCLFVLPR